MRKLPCRVVKIKRSKYTASKYMYKPYMAKDAYKSRKFLWWNLEPYMKIAAKVLVSACKTKYTHVVTPNTVN